MTAKNTVNTAEKGSLSSVLFKRLGSTQQRKIISTGSKQVFIT